MKNFGECNTCKAFPSSIFSCLGGQKSAANLSEKSIPMVYEKGQEIYKEGSPFRGVFCIQEGKVKISKSCLKRKFILRLCGISDLLGFESLFTNDRFTNSAICLEQVRLCFIPKSVITALLEKEENLLMAMFHMSTKENNHLVKVITNLKCINMLGRVANSILVVADKYGIDEIGRLKVQLTRKDLSELSFTTVESAIRILNDLKKEKLVSIDNSTIRILNETKLRFYASQNE